MRGFKKLTGVPFLWTNLEYGSWQERKPEPEAITCLTKNARLRPR
jgi:hypothetical protein